MNYKIKDQEIGIFSMARTSSRRCKRKMIRKFDNTTLTDIVLSNLSKLGKNTFFAGYEPIFKKKSLKHKVRFVQRTKKSSECNASSLELMSFLKNQNYKYLLFINGCIPNIKIKTIKKFLNICKKKEQPAFAMFERKNYFLDKDNRPINFKSKNLHLDTGSVKKIKEFSNMLYFFEREYFLAHGAYWDWHKLRYITIQHGIETIDIDTEEDFQLAEIIWKHFNC